MQFTTVASDAFQKFQLNAGVLTTEFDPANPFPLDRSKIFIATNGGANFTATPTFVDFADDVDNVPANTKELKVLQSVEVTLSGTGKTLDTATAKRLMAAANIGANGKVTPRLDLRDSDFADLWWVGDYSDVNTGASAGFIAIRLINALSTGGFALQSQKNGKADYAFTFTGHYSINDMTIIPYELYIVEGVEDATLSALTIGSLTLSPTFDSDVVSYTATTTNATNTITATPTDSNATVAITVGTTAVENGSSATWATGSNTVTVVVTNGDETKTYTVTVTKS